MLNEYAQDFEELSKNTRKISKLLEEYKKLMMAPTENAFLLQKKLSEIIKVTGTLPEFGLKGSLISWIEYAKDELEKAKEDFRFQFGQQLKEILQKEGKKLRGQYPLLKIDFYTLQLNFEFGEATLYFGPEIEKIRSKIPLQPKVIFETIKRYDSDLRTAKSTPEDTLKTLREAYSRRLKLDSKSFGDKLLIIDVLNEFVMLKQSKRFFTDPKKANFREYSRVKLSYLLYLLKKCNLSDKGLRLHVATFDATTDKMHSIWILENEHGEGTYYSYISFEK